MNNFKIAQPHTVDQVTSMTSEQNYYLMAGGTDLLDEIKNNVVEPEVIIDLNSIPDLAYIKSTDKGLHIGALTKVSELADNLQITKDYPVVHEAALSLATPQLRNVGTVGGNICQRPRCWYYRDPQVKCRKKGGSRCYAFKGKNRYHAIFGGGLCYIVHPSDLAPALISLDSEVTISTKKGDKSIPLVEFYALPRANVHRENILKSNEIVKEILIPPPKKGAKSTYFKLKERGTWDFAIVSVAVNGIISGGAFKDIKIVMGGVAPIPWRLEKAEKLIIGKKVTEKIVRDATKNAMADAKPLAENAYKKDLAEVIVASTIMSLV
jgi:xanthine dehydrogenase YagS FAD-binding subunit